MIHASNRFSKELIQKINENLGRKYSFIDRIKLRGIGSGQLIVTDASENLKLCLGNNHDTKFVIIELRPKGLLVYLKNYVNNYVWLVPFDKMALFRSQTFSIHSMGEFLKIDLTSIKKNKNNKQFIRKMMKSKNRTLNI